METVLIEINAVADKESCKLDIWAKTGMRQGKKCVCGGGEVAPPSRHNLRRHTPSGADLELV